MLFLLAIFVFSIFSLSALAHPDAAFYRSYDLAHPTPTPTPPRLIVRSEQPKQPPRLARRGNCHRKAQHRASASSSSSASSSAAASTATSLTGYHDSTCGASGAADKTSASGGPNGSERWLNCGLSEEKPDAGWTPPQISLSQLKTLTLEEALAMPNSIYANCEPYVKLFENYADKHGLPPILLAAFAMQESSCKVDTLGDAGGAFGLMQITEDKCGDAPDGNCSEAEYNIKTAAAYFAKTLEEQGGNLLLALGTYNGWYSGLTFSKATAAADGDCCECQQGWLLGLDGSKLGTIRNLKLCSS